MSEQDMHLVAADWVARLRDPKVSPEETLQWQRWLEEDLRHAEVFARMEEVANRVQALPRMPLPSPDRVVRDRYDGSVPIAQWREPPRRRPAFAIAASLAVAAIVLGWVATRPDTEVLRTAIGENRTVRLADGSRVVMGADTRIVITIDSKSRRIDLSDGEAFFTVAKDSTRPFRVNAGETSVVAVGTEFNMRRREDRVVVAVVEGKVIVEPRQGFALLSVLRERKPVPAAVSVTAGQQTIATAAGIEAAMALPDPSAPTAWQTGRLPFRLEPLRYVVEDVNRYLEKPIVIEDENIGAMPFTGTVMTSNVEGWVASLEGVFELDAVEEEGQIVLRRRE